MRTTILLPGWDAAPAPGYYCGRSCGLGNGEWRMMRCTCCQGCGSCTMFICQLGEGQWAMEPMDGATIPGKMYSKLWGKVVAIIKFLPPCKLWLKFHDFWKGDRTILLLRITLSSTQTEIPAEIPWQSGIPCPIRFSNLVQCISVRFSFTCFQNLLSGFTKTSASAGRL